MKARELILTKANKIYIKEHNEDYRSTTGIFSYKGKYICNSAKPSDETLVFNSSNEQIQYIANLIDKQMYTNYKLYPNNYIAYDIKHNTNRFQQKYTEAEKRIYETHSSTS